MNVGDRMFGTASIGCPSCAKTHYYYVYAIHGIDGWYCESPEPLSDGAVKVVLDIQRGNDDPNNYCPGTMRRALEDVQITK